MADRPAGICVLGTGLLSYFLLTDFNKSLASAFVLASLFIGYFSFLSCTADYYLVPFSYYVFKAAFS